MFTYVYILCHHIVAFEQNSFAGEAKGSPVSRADNVHAMSRETHKDDEEPLPKEQKGNTKSHYT